MPVCFGWFDDSDYNCLKCPCRNKCMEETDFYDWYYSWEYWY